MKVIAEAQCTHLAERPRQGGTQTAVKTRKRTAPAEPTAPRAKRTRQVATRAQPAQPADSPWRPLPEVAGLHEVRIAGPWPRARAWPKTKAGALKFKAWCCRCDRTAGDSNRLVELLRKPCRPQDLASRQWVQRMHEPLHEGPKAPCKRCGVTRTGRGKLQETKCPVFTLEVDGQVSDAGTAWYGQWRDRIAHLRNRERSPVPAVEVHESLPTARHPTPASSSAQEGGATRQAKQLRAGYSCHRAIDLAGQTFCIACFATQPRYNRRDWASHPCDGWAPGCGSTGLCAGGRQPCRYRSGRL